MTETANYGFKKPDATDPVDISVLNDNFDSIDEELKNKETGTYCKINLYSSVTINFSQDEKTVDVTEAISAEIAKALSARYVIPIICIRGSNGGPAVTVLLDSSYEVADVEYVRTVFTGVTAIGYSDEWAEFSLDIEWFLDGTYTATLTYQKRAQNGNVDVTEGAEQPVRIDLSGYDAGTIRLTYADGGTMDVAVTFDEAGNPVKFSNGTEEFAVTWPAEDAAEEGA